MNDSQSEPVLQLSPVDDPTAVSDDATIVLHGSGNPQDRGFGSAVRSMGQESCDGIGSAGKIRNLQMLDRSDFATFGDREASVGAANVRKKKLISCGRLTATHRFAAAVSAGFPAASRTADLRFAAMRSEYHRADALGVRLCVGKST